MTPLSSALVIAALIQMAIAAANLMVARRLEYGRNLARLTPIVSQIFIVHAAYVAGVVFWFGLLCLLFATRMTAGDPLARFLAGGLATFWGVRLVLQLAVYDKRVRRRHRLEDLAFILACVYLTLILSAAAVRP